LDAFLVGMDGKLKNSLFLLKRKKKYKMEETSEKFFNLNELKTMLFDAASKSPNPPVSKSARLQGTALEQLGQDQRTVLIPLIKGTYELPTTQKYPMLVVTPLATHDFQQGTKVIRKRKPLVFLMLLLSLACLAGFTTWFILNDKKQKKLAQEYAFLQVPEEVETNRIAMDKFNRIFVGVGIGTSALLLLGSLGSIFAFGKLEESIASLGSVNSAFHFGIATWAK
jgi:hypothetical protein